MITQQVKTRQRIFNSWVSFELLARWQGWRTLTLNTRLLERCLVSKTGVHWVVTGEGGEISPHQFPSSGDAMIVMSIPIRLLLGSGQPGAWTLWELETLTLAHWPAPPHLASTNISENNLVIFGREDVYMYTHLTYKVFALFAAGSPHVDIGQRHLVLKKCWGAMEQVWECGGWLSRLKTGLIKSPVSSVS